MALNKVSEIVPFTEECCPNGSTIIHFAYGWIVNDINFNARYQSPIFSPRWDKELKWRVHLNGTSEGMEQSLCLLPCNLTEMTLKYELEYIYYGYGTYTPISFKHSSTKAPSSTDTTEYKMVSLLKKDCLMNSVLPNYKEPLSSINLLITCNVKLLIPGKTTVMEQPRCPHCRTLGFLLETKKFSDVTINVAGHELVAHKAILSVRSPVFAAMFEHGLTGNRLIIDDVEPTVFVEMLRYMYTSQVFNIKKIAGEMLTAAKNYGLEGLQRMCIKSLQDNLTIDNALETFVVADRHNVESLKAQVMDLMADNLSDLIKSSKYQQLCESHPILMTTFMDVIAEKLQDHCP